MVFILSNFSKERISTIIQNVAEQAAAQPNYNWLGEQNIWQSENNAPKVQVSVAACDLDFDLWNHARGASKIGMHPITLEQIYSYWSFYNKEKVDSEGRGKMFQTLTNYSDAKKKYKRAVIISAMLPFNDKTLQKYAAKATMGDTSPMEMYCTYYGQINSLFSNIIDKVALVLYNDNVPVIPMSAGNLDRITEMVVPMVNRDASNGYCKAHFSHKTISTMTGLAQTGVSRLAMRHTADEQGGHRFMGPVLSIIAFDETELEDSEKGTLILSDDWLELSGQINDQTVQNDDVNSVRYCRYGDGKCGLCLVACPSGALQNSSPQRDGTYPQRILNQQHRFADGTLQFDAGKCNDYKGTLKGVYNDWMCGRCYITCGAFGAVDVDAVKKFEELLDYYRK